MSLAKNKWRYVGSAVFGSATCAAVLDALWSLLVSTNTTYPDGGSTGSATTRTAGAGSAASWSRYQNGGTTEAIYANTRDGSGAILVAGAAALPAPNPTMASPDTAATNTLMVNIVKTPGAFNAWNAASPMTSGTTFGYWRVWPTSAGTGTVRVWESTGGIWFTISTPTGATYHAVPGLHIDPESTDTTFDSESDGFLYGIFNSGSGTEIAVVNHSTDSSVTLFSNSVSASACHGGVLTPGGSAILGVKRASSTNVTMTTTGTKTRSGGYHRWTIPMRYTPAAPNDGSAGRLREITIVTDALNGQKQAPSGAVSFYFVGTHESSTSDGWALEAGP